MSNRHLTAPRLSTSSRSWPPISSDLLQETLEEREARQQEEKRARQASRAIDAEIAKERAAARNGPLPIKVLLLGQAESGKSTLLKNFQMHFAPDAFREESEAWRAVIYLNLVRTVNFILDLLDSVVIDPMAAKGGSTPAPLRRLQLSLSPLRGVEKSLKRRLSPDDAFTQPDPTGSYTSFDTICASEFSVRSGSQWKTSLKKARESYLAQEQLEAANAENRGSYLRVKCKGKAEEEMDAARRVIEACRDDIAGLWAHQRIRDILSRHGVMLEEQSGFFLDEIDRIAVPDWEPTFSDILRARIATIGVEEYRIPFENHSNLEKPLEWLIYDITGSMKQRPAWAQFFDDVHVIMFLVPISAFDQTLAEDKETNRLLDSFNLWRMICSHRLLADTPIILFLNKYDLLDRKLKSGVEFVRFARDYQGNNDAASVANYLLDKFRAMHKQFTPKRRKLITHVTCTIDIVSTARVLQQIQECILEKAIEQVGLV